MKKIISVLITMIMFALLPSNCFAVGNSSDKTSIEPKVVWEGHDTSIEVTGIKESIDSYDVSFIIKNNSSLNLSFDVHAYAVNGVMGDDSQYSFYTSIPSGKKAISNIEISKLWMRNMRVDSIQYLDILFWAYDDAKSYKEFETDIVRVETSAYIGEHTYSASGEATYEDDNFTIIGEFREGLIAAFAVINNTDEYVSIEADDASVNGWAFDTYIQVYDDYIFPGCLLQCIVTIDSEFADMCDIQELSDFEFSLDIRPLNDYMNRYTIGPVVIK